MLEREQFTARKLLIGGSCRPRLVLGLAKRGLIVPLGQNSHSVTSVIVMETFVVLPSLFPGHTSDTSG